VDIHFKIELRIKNDCRKKSTFKQKRIAICLESSAARGQLALP
jgi:hypothetical protein